MRKTTDRHSLDSVFALLLFAMFAACLLLVLLLGARSYQETAAAGSDAYAERVGLHYLAAKVRHNDSADAVRVAAFDAESPQVQALFLTQEYGGTLYDTRIYYYDGGVRELFAERGLDFAPEDGSVVLEAQGLELELKEDLLTVTYADSLGQSSRLCLWLRAAGEELP